MTTGNNSSSGPNDGAMSNRPSVDKENNIDNNSREAMTPAKVVSSSSAATHAPRMQISNPYSSKKKIKKDPFEKKDNDNSNGNGQMSNDDDVMVLSPRPPPYQRRISSSTSNDGSGCSNNHEASKTNDDDDVVMEYSNASNALIDLPHPRPICGKYSFDVDANRIQHCDNCYCVLCQLPAKECTDWANHCQVKVKNKQKEETDDDEEDNDDEADVIDVDRTNPMARNGASQSYHNRRAHLARRAQAQAAAAAAAGAYGSGDYDDGDDDYFHHYTNEFNHAYNNKGKERGRSPKDMKITEVLAQKLHDALQLSEGSPTASGPTVDGGSFESRKELRKKRFDQCKPQGDIPQLDLHNNFFVEGVRIGWPYPSILTPQRQMALHLTRALKKSKHVVIESPTGTGKSAAILCSVLGWQRYHAKKIWGNTVGREDDYALNADMTQGAATSKGLESPNESKFPRIIYCSRTHSQVAQMVASLKKTSYRPRMTVLGSRKQFCIHRNIQDQRPSPGEKAKKVNVDAACKIRVANTEKMRKALWNAHDYTYNDDRPPVSLPNDGDGNALGSQDDDEDDPTIGDRERSSEWIFKRSTTKKTCPHYRQLSSSRTAQMTRRNFLVNQDAINCCKVGGEKTKLGVHDIEDLVSFGLNPYMQSSVALYRRNSKESFGIDVSADCTIQAIQADSPAEFNQQLRKGDKILEVNGRKVVNSSMLQKEFAKTTNDMIELKVISGTSSHAPNAFKGTSQSHQNESSFKEVDVFLYRQPGEPIGMTLQGSDGDNKGCSVNTIKDGSAAARAGNLKEGDTIVSVNGENVANLTYNAIVAKIKSTESNPLRLGLRRQDNASATGDVLDDIDENDDDEDPYSPHSACPYYTSRVLAKHAELLFAPYNYILDPGIRKALDINLDGTVVVLDEGHNVESVLTESGSGKFGEIELSKLVATLSFYASAPKSRQNRVQVNNDEVDLSDVAHELLLFVEKLCKCMRKEKDRFEKSTGALGATKAIEEYLKYKNTPDNKEFEVLYKGPSGYGVKNKAVGGKPFFDDLKITRVEIEKLLEYAAALETHIKGESRDQSSEKEKDGPSDLMMGLLSKLSLAAAHSEHFYISIVIAANGNLDHAAGEEADDGRSRRGHFKKKPTTMPFIYPRAETNPNATLFVCTKCKNCNQGNELIRHGDWIDGSTPPWEAHLKIRLLFPGLLMKDLATQCRTVVLASGSISPLGSLCAELDLRGAEAGRLQTQPKPLEANHVIDLPRQLFACAIGTFPDGSPLTVTYQNYSQPEFIPRLGYAIASIVESVADGGILVFLPSYTVLNRCMRCWNPSEFGGGYNRDERIAPEIWDRFLRSKGKVVVEPSGSSQEAFEAARDEYAAAIKEYGNAILFAVFRGKMSEGISFNDANCRGVICVGLPLPNYKDRNIEAKRHYNDEQRKLNKRTDLLPGSDWYAQEAYRAIAQALGRCIRHQGDYGTVILLDSRHCDNGAPGFSHSKLPKWMRNAVRTLSHSNVRGHGQHPILSGYPGLKRELEQFFAQAPGYCHSVLAKRKKEYEDAVQRDARKRKAEQSVECNNNDNAAKKITQDSPVPPSMLFRSMKKEKNGVVDLVSPPPG